MSMQTDIAIEINRLIMRGLQLSPGRAERVRELAESALQELLSQDDTLSRGLEDSEVALVNAQSLHITERDDDYRLANELAQGIARSLSGIGTMEIRG